jgi:hypothetical protein
VTTRIGPPRCTFNFGLDRWLAVSRGTLFRLIVYTATTGVLVKQIGSNHTLWLGVTGRGEDPAEWPANLRV